MQRKGGVVALPPCGWIYSCLATSESCGRISILNMQYKNKQTNKATTNKQEE